MIISKDELITLSPCHFDPIGRVYRYVGGGANRIIRIINESARKHVELLMKSGLVDKLIQEGLLVDSWISDDVDEEGKMILEHKRITPSTYWSQWSFEMMKDAARLVLKLNMICWEYGYELKDCHQNNVLFVGARPVYIDFGSIVKKSGTGWIAREEFFKSYYYPIKLWTKGYINIVVALMQSSTNNLSVKEMKSILYCLPLNVVELLTVSDSWLPQKSAMADMRALFSKMDRLKCDEDTVWGEYQSGFWGHGAESVRFKAEIDWINEKPDIETMVELGANQGYFSALVATRTKLKKIIATDYDRKAVDIMYRKIRGSELSDKIIPLVLDFRRMPTDQLNEFQSDLVVANALTHHLLLTQNMDMCAITEGLAELTSKYVIVEFMEYGVNQRKSDLPKWYTLANFLNGLEEKFSIICVKKTVRKRTMIIGIKKEMLNL